MDYSKLLEYYLTSDEWEYELLCFFEDKKHKFDPWEEDPDKEHGRYYLLSDVYMYYTKKIRSAGGCYFDLQLTDNQFQQYFGVQYDSEQRFSILFGMWWGLSDTQIDHLSNLGYQKSSTQLLNFFLCNPEVEVPPSNAELEIFHYTGRYYADIFEERLQENKIVPVKEILPDGRISLDEQIN